MNSQNSNIIYQQILSHLNNIYPKKQNTNFAKKIFTIFLNKKKLKINHADNRWNESDVVMITYMDTFQEKDKKHIDSLRKFMDLHLKDVISIIHILPFFPYSSDDGFSVIDYLQIKKGLGTWSDIKKLSANYKIMGDLVINHCSSQSDWFKQFLNNQSPGKSFFHYFKKPFDTTSVTRPRSHELLQKYKTRSGDKFVWCTFSRDQIDLDFSNQDVLLTFLQIIKFYLDHGVSVLRLDAVAFLWKEIGTSCINLPQTHEIIKLIRLIMDNYSKKTFLITETNLPNKENLDYFGNGNEAHLIYNFSLPPIILYTMLFGDASILRKWLMSMPPPMEGNTYFNFIASHDGIGMRPAEGLIAEKNIKAILKKMKSLGGQISYRKINNKQKPYEINIALFDAFKETIHESDNYQIQRFICAHIIMFSLEGIPAIYVHSFLGTENYYEGVKETNEKRTINRKKFKITEILKALQNKTKEQKILNALKQILLIRKSQSAFHPNATQFTLNLGKEVFAIWRQSHNRKQSIFVIANVTNNKQSIDLNEINLIFNKHWVDLITNKKIESKKITLKPYQVLWITNL
jgi:sucrose phosphorylase